MTIFYIEIRNKDISAPIFFSNEFEQKPLAAPLTGVGNFIKILMSHTIKNCFKSRIIA